MARRRTHFSKITLILVAVFVVLAITAAIVAYSLVSDMVRHWNMTNLPGISDLPQATSVNAQGTPIAPNVPLQAVAGPPAKAWDGTSRVTVLVMGLDYSDWRKQTEGWSDASRTDSMILLTVDPLSKTAGMLSIPRDMWVNIPGGYGYNKINQAYYFGELDKLPGGGPGLAMDTVEKFIGVPIDYYAQIDFSAFEKFIDDLGGVEIDVPEEITVGVMFESEVTLKPGKQLLSGKVALGYARQRYTDGGDVDRANRQQQVIMAIRDRILSINMLPTLITKAPDLYAQLSSGIKTNLTLDQVTQLAYLATQIPQNNIKKAVISYNEADLGTSPDGLSILVPYPDKIRVLRDQVFSTGGPVGPAAVGQDAKTLAVAENARITVLNGSAVGGMAAKTGSYLKDQPTRSIRIQP
jgi:LCP family protein required for cell wall assembly